VLLDRGDDALAGELAETIRHILLLIVQSAKHIGMLTRIDKANEMCVLVPTVLGVQAALLREATKFTPTKVLIQSATTLSWMRLDQDAIVHESRMIWHHQQHQGFISVGIVPNLIELRMRGWNHLIALEMMMNDRLPTRHLALTEGWQTCSLGVPAFDH